MGNGAIIPERRRRREAIRLGDRKRKEKYRNPQIDADFTDSKRISTCANPRNLWIRPFFSSLSVPSV